MDQAAPAEAGAAAERKRPLLRRIPTSIVVTLLGIALTAWLLPAFTRQWDDRQRARELKASVAAQIAAATADAIVRGMDAERKIAARYAPPGGDTRIARTPIGTSDLVTRTHDSVNRLYEPWLRQRFIIDAKLRAYFPPAVYDRMRRYDGLVFLMLDLGSGQYTSDLTGDEVWSVSIQDDSALLGVTPKRLRTDIHALAVAIGGSGAQRADGFFAFRDIAAAVRERQSQFIAAILASHVDGYSTTTRDLIHDLIP